MYVDDAIRCRPGLSYNVTVPVLVVVATVKINLKRIKKKENMEQFNLDMLKDEHMRQQYAVEVNNMFDCLEHEVIEQEYE